MTGLDPQRGPDRPDGPDSRPPPFTSLQATIETLNRAVKDQVSCVHDVLRPGASDGAKIPGILECARCGLIQESRRTGTGTNRPSLPPANPPHDPA